MVQTFLRPLILLVGVVAALAAGPSTAAAQTPPPNPVVVENARPGDDRWQGTDAAPVDLEAYAKSTSAPVGGSLALAVRATVAYRIEVHRLGWYGGSGGRRVACLPADCSATLPAVAQTPPGTPDATTGLLAANWTTTDTWSVPADAVSGEYLAEIVLAEGPSAGASVRVPFVVRAASGATPAPILKVTETATIQAYNNWGGRSVYDHNSTPSKAVKVSYDRPNAPVTRLHDKGYLYTNHAMVKWLERQGYAMDYVSDVDLAKDPSMLLRHRNVIVEGHQEYWDSATRDGFSAAVAQGTNVMFVGANLSYWQIRYEDDHRTLVVYKYDPDPWPIARERTTLFRLLGRAECQLKGVQYGSHDTTNYTLRGYTLDAASLGDPWLAGTGFAAGDTVPGVVGYEWDAIVPGCANATVKRFFTYDGGPRGESNADLVRTTHPSGARVFAAGTLQFPWALDAYPTRPAGVQVDPRMQQFVGNVVEDLGRPAAPATLGAAREGGGVRLSWTLPSADPRLTDVRVYRRTGAEAFAPGDAGVTEVCTVAVATGATCLDAGAPATSTYRYLAVARDRWGMSTGTLSAAVERLQVTVTLRSTPAGAPLVVDGVSRTAPWSGPASIGASIAFGTAAKYDAGGRRLAFARWSDGGPRERAAFTVPADGLTLTAEYDDLGPLAPVAAFGFDDGAGAVARDSSGAERDGAVRGARWVVTGRHGGALDFDGVDDWVTVADDPALDLTGAMTLSAWVRPDVLASYDNVLLKEASGGLAYGLYATSGGGTGQPSGFAGAAGVYAPTPIVAGEWVHLALTSDSREVTLWRDGVAVDRAPVPAAAPVSDGVLRIGGTAVWADEFFDGLIDDVRIHARALDAEDLAAAMASGVPAPGPSSAPPAPVAAYGFDEGRGSVARDSSGNGLDGTLSGGAAWTAAGRNGGGLSFDGVDDLVTVADAAALDLTGGATVSAWARLDAAADSYNAMVVKEDAGRVSYALYATDSDGRQPNGIFGEVVAYSPETIARDTWVHVAMVADGARVRIFLDGRLSGEAPLSGPAVPSAGVLRIGGTTVWSGENFQGVLDDVRVYDRALTEVQLAADRERGVPSAGPLPVAAWAFDAIGQDGSTPDASGNGLSGAVRGATSSPDGRFGGALAFDGLDDWVTVADDPRLELTGALSMTAWVKPSDLGDYDTVLLRERGSGFSYGLYATNGGGEQRPTGYAGDGAAYAPQRIVAGTWTHLATTSDGTTVRLWVNGVLVDSAPATGALASDGVLRIGGNGVWDGEFFSGLIDDVRLYDVALTEEQLAEAIAEPAAPAAPGGASFAMRSRPATSDPSVAPVGSGSLAAPSSGGAASDEGATSGGDAAGGAPSGGAASGGGGAAGADAAPVTPGATPEPSTQAASASPANRTLHPLASLRATRRAVRRGAVVALRGQLSGDWVLTREKVVTLQVLRGRRWVTVRTAAVDARGRFVVSQRVARAERAKHLRFRVRTAPQRGSGIAAATSPAVRVTLTRR